MYIHCAKCMRSLPGGVSAEDYSRLSVSIEEDGLLISCIRHNETVVLMDPVMLLNFMERPPECEMCKAGVPHKH